MSDAIQQAKLMVENHIENLMHKYKGKVVPIPHGHKHTGRAAEVVDIFEYDWRVYVYLHVLKKNGRGHLDRAYPDNLTNYMIEEIQDYLDA